MSHLLVSSAAKTYQMNVLAFSSPVFGSIESAQTRRKAIHFPVKITQPEIQFDVVFRGEKEFEEFQRFVRSHQRSLLTTAAPLTLNWPQRNISNWTGVIKSFRGGNARFNYLPRARFTVELVTSSVSSRTEIASVGMGWRSVVYGIGLPDSVLQLPSLAEAQEIFAEYGQNIFDAGRSTTPGVTPTPTGNTPVAPQLPGPGILTGTGS